MVTFAANINAENEREAIEKAMEHIKDGGCQTCNNGWTAKINKGYKKNENRLR